MDDLGRCAPSSREILYKLNTERLFKKRALVVRGEGLSAVSGSVDLSRDIDGESTSATMERRGAD